MRGKLIADSYAEAALRSIPAHAGQTYSPSQVLPNIRVDPRACGVNETPQAIPGAVNGRSPRMRGKPDADI